MSHKRVSLQYFEASNIHQQVLIGDKHGIFNTRPTPPHLYPILCPYLRDTVANYYYLVQYPSPTILCLLTKLIPMVPWLLFFLATNHSKNDIFNATILNKLLRVSLLKRFIEVVTLVLMKITIDHSSSVSMSFSYILPIRLLFNLDNFDLPYGLLWFHFVRLCACLATNSSPYAISSYGYSSEYIHVRVIIMSKGVVISLAL